MLVSVAVSAVSLVTGGGALAAAPIGVVTNVYRDDVVRLADGGGSGAALF